MRSLVLNVTHITPFRSPEHLAYLSHHTHQARQDTVPQQSLHLRAAALPQCRCATTVRDRLE